MKLAALGAFDGLHLGHWKVLEAAGPSPGIVFFQPVPKQVFAGTAWSQRLTTAGERYEMLRDKGINSIITLPFDGRMMETPPEEFAGMLADIGLFSGYVVGYDFRYGKGALGTTETLGRDLLKHGLSLTVVKPEALGSLPVKSGRIRSYIRRGNLEEASALLGRFYGATGVVARGRGFGRSLGFPTLNIRVPGSKLLPPAGSYAAFAGKGCFRRKAVAFVVPGKNLIEVHVPSMRGELYGECFSTELVSFIRAPEPFGSEDELKSKITEDLKISMEVLKEWQ